MVHLKKKKEVTNIIQIHLPNSLAKFTLKLEKVGTTTRPFSYDLSQIPYSHTGEVTNRFKGLNLIDRVPKEVCTEVHDIVQKAGIKMIPKKKKCKNTKWLFKKASQKRWQEYTEELYKKDLHDPDNHDGVITHLEPDILEGKVKWALGSITASKASGDDGIPVELFQILKDDAVKVLHSICQQIWKTQQWPQDLKISVFIPITKKGNA